jgi:hypothetical protein
MKRLCILMIALVMISLTGRVVGAETKTVTSVELIRDANILDGNVVTYEGEIVAAIMKRGDHSWVNLSDGYNAIGVWCETNSLSDVRTIGNYKNEGDILEVTGVFHRACPEHGGELDLHADILRIEDRGFAVEEHISARRIDISIAFFILALLAIFMFRKRL